MTQTPTSPQAMGAGMPTLGRDVHYVLSAVDAQLINDTRKLLGIPRGGNDAAAGDVCAAKVVRVFPGAQAVNLQVFLDGSDSYWATSRARGEDGTESTWHWPPRVI